MSSYTIPKLKKQNGFVLFPMILKLMVWRFKQTWRLLLITWLSLVALIVLVCAVPLLSTIASTAVIRNVLLAPGRGSDAITVQMGTTKLAKDQITKVDQEMQRIFSARGIKQFIKPGYSFTVYVNEVDVLKGNSQTAEAKTSLLGYDWANPENKVSFVEGTYPKYTTDVLEVVITQQEASKHTLKLGSTIQLRTSSSAGSVMWTARVVGITSESPGSVNSGGGGDSQLYEYNFSGPVPNAENYFSVYAHQQALFDKAGSLQVTGDGKYQQIVLVDLSYKLNVESIDASNYKKLSDNAPTFNMGDMGLQNVSPNITHAYANPSALYNLNSFSSTLAFVQVVLVFLLLLILFLAFYMVSLMSNTLVERQHVVIATLRSRGATKRHIFGAFFWQIMLLWLTALAIAPFVAALFVNWFAQLTLPTQDQKVTQKLLSQPGYIIQSIGWFPVVVVVIALLVMILAIRKALKNDIVALRREGSRSTQKPLWRRLNLDLVAMVLLLVGYGAYVYFTQFSGQIPGYIRDTLFGGFAFIAIPAVILISLLFFMRLLPGILRITTRIATKRPSAPPTLAFAQMERSPQVASRMVTLLSLAMATSIFLITLIVSFQAQQLRVASFRVGADFSGTINENVVQKSPQEIASSYSSISGVSGVTVGYRKVRQEENSMFTTSVMAVDPATYTKAGLWRTQSEQATVNSMLKQLEDKRAESISNGTVYAIADAAAWKMYGLAPGEAFNILVPGTASKTTMRFIALAQVTNIPGAYTDARDDQPRGIGIIVDFETYAAAFKKTMGTELKPNYVWLKTNDNSATLKEVREKYPDLVDRRELEDKAKGNVLQLNMVNVLSLGIVLAILLALVGALLSSWFTAVNRQTNFAVMRALGMAPHQITAILLWEQGFIYLLALVLGLALGYTLHVFITPIIAFMQTSLNPERMVYGSANVPLITIEWPWLQLSFVIGGVVLVCIVSLLLMARIVTSPVVSQRLRLNED